MPTIQGYPRIQDEEHEFNGYLDDDQLVQHSYKITEDELEKLILEAIEKANSRSGREIISIPEDATQEETEKIYRDKAWDLVQYFQAYPGDPASTAQQLENRQNSRDLASELFDTRTLQMGRMTRWRYQYLAVDCAGKTGRFNQLSDRGTKEADFVAVIRYKNAKRAIDQVNLYVSVKNRVTPSAGRIWPNSIQKLEEYAIADKNKIGPYCCIFGIAMGSGLRQMKRNGKTKDVFSWNTEVWLSDYFWPFFTNFSYADIMLHVLDVLKICGDCP